MHTTNIVSLQVQLISVECRRDEAAGRGVRRNDETGGRGTGAISVVSRDVCSRQSQRGSMSYKRRWNDRRQAETARPRPLRPRLCSAFVVVQTCSCARIPYRDTHTSCLIQTSIIPPPDYLHRLPLLL